MANDLNLIEQVANTVQNTNPVAAFFMGAGSLYLLLHKRVCVTDEMAKLREENAGFKAKIEYLETHITDLETRLEKLEAKPARSR